MQEVHVIFKLYSLLKYCNILKYFIYLFKTASLTFLSYILFELLDVGHGSPISHKKVKCNSLCLALAIYPYLRENLYTIIAKY